MNLNNYTMKLKVCFFSLLFIPFIIKAQYEQKITLNFAAGIFNTLGKKVDESGPTLLPNYELGLSANGGVQFRINENFSLSVDIGIMFSQRWSYFEGSDKNYLYWSIHDTITDDLIAEGGNYRDIANYSFGLTPKYYLFPGKRWNPYFYMGVNFNLTSTYFEDEEWQEMDKRNLLPPDDAGPKNDILENNFGLGLNPGFGIEFTPGAKVHLYLTAGYYFIPINKDNFTNPLREEKFNAFILQVGTRINFIKTKDL